MDPTPRKPLRILACGVFEPALARLDGLEPDRHAVTFLPARLHLFPEELKRRLGEEVDDARARGERPVCLFGLCFPEIGAWCEARGVARVRGLHCTEMLLGEKRYGALLEEDAGTFFLERELILDFDRSLLEPLELWDEDLRREYFRHYQRLVYVRQPDDPDLTDRARALADYLGLALEIHDAEDDHLTARLAPFLDAGGEAEEGAGP